MDLICILLGLVIYGASIWSIIWMAENVRKLRANFSPVRFFKIGILITLFCVLVYVVLLVTLLESGTWVMLAGLGFLAISPWILVIITYKKVYEEARPLIFATVQILGILFAIGLHIPAAKVGTG